MMNNMRNASQRNFGLTILLGTMAFGLGGCATENWVKKYVSEQTAPIEAGVAKADARVTQVDTRVTQVSAQTAEARKVADDGVRKADAVNSRVTQALANRYKRTLVETVPLRYAPGKFTLLADHKTALAGVLKKLADNPTFTADIVGYTDATGSEKQNYELSWRREERVRRYLSENAAVLHRIAFIGLGEDKADGPKNDPADRQVTIVIYRPMD